MKSSLKITIFLPFFLLALLLLLPNSKSVVKQYRSLNEFLPVSATILESKVSELPRKGRDVKPTYKPHIEYQFEVQGKQYTSRDIYPIRDVRSKRWALSVVKGFKKNRKVTAYYNPQNPEQAYLIRVFLFTPYFGMLAGIFFLGIGSVPLFFPIERDKIKVGKIEGKESFRLFTEFPYGYRENLSYFLCTFFALTGAFVMGHYLFNASKPYDAIYSLSSGVWYFITLVCFGSSIYYFLMNRKLGPLTISTTQETFHLQEPLALHFSLPVKMNCFIKLIQVNIQLEKTVRKNYTGRGGGKKVTVWSDSITLIENRQYKARELITMDTQFEVPLNKETETASTSVGTGFYRWRLIFKMKLAPGLRFVDKYPFEVHRALEKNKKDLKQTT